MYIFLGEFNSSAGISNEDDEAEMDGGSPATLSRGSGRNETARLEKQAQGMNI